jgi:lycopene cyclase domain-containing protein
MVRPSMALRSRRFRILAGLLLAAVLCLVALTLDPSYLRLHLFLLAPLLALALLPPRPLQSAPREIRLVGHVIPLVVAAIACVFSASWDNFLAAKGVWTVEADRMIGTAGFMPFEEYLWFIDHTLLASVWVLDLWSTKGQRSVPSTAPRRAARIAGAALCLVATIAGLWLLQFDRSLYLGVILSFMSPVAGLQWWIGGHLLLQQRREWLLGIAVPSLYFVLLDTWAIHQDVWRISVRYTTGALLFGIQAEQILVYSTTTVLVVQALVIALRMTENLLQRKDEDESVWAALIREVVSSIQLAEIA